MLAFRGASSISSVNAGSWLRSGNLDAYGDSYTNAQHIKLGTNQSEAFFPTFVNGGAWAADLSDLDGARFVQARITQISNAATGMTTRVSGLGIPYDL